MSYESLSLISGQQPLVDSANLRVGRGFLDKVVVEITTERQAEPLRGKVSVESAGLSWVHRHRRSHVLAETRVHSARAAPPCPSF